MEPAWLPAGRLVFSSPVPRLAADATSGPVSALYTLAITGGPPARLTWGVAPATDPTVLSDGRVLFVSGTAAAEGGRSAAQSLFTVNNDGTEIAAYAGQHDGPAAMRRPREAADGRVVFLAAGVGTPVVEGRIEQVLTARPFHSRSVVFPQLAAPCRSVEPTVGGDLLATLREPGPDRELSTFAVYRLAPGATSAGRPVFDDPGWNEVEAVSATLPARPMGRLSTVDPVRHDGLLLCLDANHTERRAGRNPAKGTQLRVVRAAAGHGPDALGCVPLEADGSVLMQVPADTALSLEVLDEGGQVLRRCPPTVWVRPGENRSCVGCHEAHNEAPGNRRPLAVARPARVLGAEPPGLSQR